MAPWPAPGGTAVPGDASAPAAVAFQSVTTSARTGAAVASTESAATAVMASSTRQREVCGSEVRHAKPCITSSSSVDRARTERAG